jgi:hypothetical protein
MHLLAGGRKSNELEIVALGFVNAQIFCGQAHRRWKVYDYTHSVIQRRRF